MDCADSFFGATFKTRHCVAPMASSGRAFTSANKGSSDSCATGIGSLSGPIGAMPLVPESAEADVSPEEPMIPIFSAGE